MSDDIVFYEKPGCINNTKQKKMLNAAGHSVCARNLLTEPWTADKLLDFFQDLPVHAWFNRSAPQVQSGDLDPDSLTAEQAIECMLQEPLLIRRPLLEVGTTKLVGFDQRCIDELVGLRHVDDEDLETCPKKGSE